VNIVAFDTATEACSAALLLGVDADGAGGVLFERFEIAPRRHAELLLPMVEALLAEAGALAAQIDAIAVTRGPGAFTGVRLGVAMAQGLALGWDKPLLAISTLAALAASAEPGAGDVPGAGVLALLDARMGEVYAGHYHLAADHTLTALSDEQLAAPDALALPPGPLHLIGSGAAVYADIWRARLGARLLAIDDAAPRARAVGRLAARAYAAGQRLAPADLAPVYLRNKVALTVAEQRAARA